MARSATASPRLAAARPIAAARPKAGQVAKIRVRDEDDVAAVASVPAVRSALGHVLLAPEAEAAVPAPARLHVNAGPVVEH